MLLPVRFSRVALAAVMSVCIMASTASAASDPAVRAAELDARLAFEEAAVKVQTRISDSINRVMSRRPATTFNIRNEIRQALSAVRTTAAAAGQILLDRLDGAADNLIDDGGTPVEVSRFRDAFDTELDDRLDVLVRQGSQDISSLLRGGRRIASVRGTLVGRYELLVSKPEDGRAPVKIGEVRLEESMMIRGPLSTAAVAEFFLARLPGPTPALADVPARSPVRAVRWIYRAGALIVAAKASRSDRFAPVEAEVFSVTGVDILPERLRIALEEHLDGTTDFTDQPDGADGFFRSVTYTFRRIAEPAAE